MNSYPVNLRFFEDERSVRDVIYTSLIMIPSIQQMKERDTVKDKSDLILITANTCLIIDFKRTCEKMISKVSLQTMIQQMRKKYSRPVYHVAMVISSQGKKILHNFCELVM